MARLQHFIYISSEPARCSFASYGPIAEYLYRPDIGPINEILYAIVPLFAGIGPDFRCLLGSLVKRGPGGYEDMQLARSEKQLA